MSMYLLVLCADEKRLVSHIDGRNTLMRLFFENILYERIYTISYDHPIETCCSSWKGIQFKDSSLFQNEKEQII